MGFEPLLRDVIHEAVVALHGNIELDGESLTTELDPRQVLFASDGTELGPLSRPVLSIVDRADLRLGRVS